ncbi:hypothetical protein CNO08_14110 [Lysobacter capsici]|nr:hypothetical protein CNO08_14110 [Lysobacter capsici]
MGDSVRGFGVGRWGRWIIAMTAAIRVLACVDEGDASTRVVVARRRALLSTLARPGAMHVDHGLISMASVYITSKKAAEAA